jgi:cytochrome c5
VSHEDDVFFATFKGVLIFLFVLMIVLIIGANMIAGDDDSSTVAVDQPAPETIAPVGKVKEPGEQAMASAPAAEPAAAPAGAGTEVADGASIYQQACFACHGTGAAGAPKLGDKAAWSSRIAQGKDTLYEHAIKGFQGSKGMMPPKGGRMDLSDDAVKAAVDHMVAQSQ